MKCIFPWVLALALCLCLAVRAEAQAPDLAGAPPELAARLAGLSKADGRTIAGARIAGFEFLPRLYQSLGYQLAWSNPTNVAALKEAIKRSWEDGLSPSDFHQELVEAFAAHAPGDVGSVDRDIVLSDALVRLLYQLYFGKVSPNGVDANWNLARPMLSEDPAKIISTAIAKGEVAHLVEQTKLVHPLYVSLKAMLQAYTQYEVAGGWPTLPAGPAVKPGATDPRIPLLRKRLAVTGEYQDDGSAPTDTLDEKLAEALRRFQKAHGLEAAGTFGIQTQAALNVSVQQRIEQIRVNLERARWVLRTVGDEMVVVNIAGYYLRVVLGGKPVWGTRVIVGKTYHKTPIFTEPMKHVVFNPDWTVPRSIVRNEIFPKGECRPELFDRQQLHAHGCQRRRRSCFS